MKIRATIYPSEGENDIEITLEELGISQEDWDEMTEVEQSDKIEAYVDNMDSLYWKLDLYKIIYP